MSLILIVVGISCWILQRICEAINWWFGSKADKANKPKLENIWYFLEEHSIHEGVKTLLNRVVQKLKIGGWKSWLWLFSLSLLPNIFVAFYMPFFTQSAFGVPQTFRGFLEFPFIIIHNEPISRNLMNPNGPVLHFWTGVFWPTLIFTQTISGISLYVSWQISKLIVIAKSFFRAAVLFAINFGIIAVLLFLTEIFQIFIRVKFNPDATLTLKQYFLLFKIFVQFDIAVGCNFVIWISLFLSDSLPLIICCILFLFYLLIWKSPNMVKRRIQHIVDRITEDIGNGKTLLTQTSTFLGWVWKFIVFILAIMGTKIKFFS
jgi:hypothetical protein